MNPAKPSWRQEMPDFLQYLECDLNYPVRLHEEVLGFHLYFVDLSSWKLRFTDRTPVIAVGEGDLATLRPRELAQSLADVVRTRSLAERNSIVLIQGPGDELRAHLKTAFIPVIVFDGTAQQAVRESRRPTAELLERLSAQLDLSLLAPYETSKPVTGSRFFGREFEIRRILQGSDSNFAIMGIRRIGKTSLMREIERQLKEQAQEGGDDCAAQRLIFMDCSAITSPACFVQEVVRKLRPQELPRLSSKQFPIFFPDFLDRMSQRYGGPLIFFLDEFDKVLTWHHEDDTLLNALRASSNVGHSRYVVGGFREVMAAFSDLDSPLYNFARPVRLKEFSREQTAAMVIGPLEKLGVRFERGNEVINRIFDETAGQPNLIQFYCSILVERLDRQGSRIVSPESLFDVYGSEDFRAFVLSTFMDNTTNLEKAMVFAVMTDHESDHPFSVQAIDEVLEKRGIQFPLSDLSHACRNLELAGTFTARGPLYRFTTPMFPRMLRENYDLDYLFKKIQQEGIW
ncbi:MAG: ATP-binding protein [Chloroflexi bacterium]|nr:ATP-binding protein [Chloroflexota bacterium]